MLVVVVDQSDVVLVVVDQSDVVLVVVDQSDVVLVVVDQSYDEEEEVDQSDVVLVDVDQSDDELEVDQSDVVLVVADQSDTVPLDDVPLDAANAAPMARAFSWNASNVLLAVGFIANTMPLPQWLFAVFASC